MTDIQTMKVPPPTVRRIIVAGILAAGFLVMASVFAPDRSQADDRDSSSQQTPAAHSAAREGLPSLGQVSNDRYMIKIFGTPNGPVYSVYDKSGVELGALLTAEQVTERFHGLHLPGARAGQPVQTMETNTSKSDW